LLFIARRGAMKARCCGIFELLCGGNRVVRNGHLLEFENNLVIRACRWIHFGGIKAVLPAFPSDARVRGIAEELNAGICQALIFISIISRKTPFAHLLPPVAQMCGIYAFHPSGACIKKRRCRLISSSKNSRNEITFG